MPLARGKYVVLIYKILYNCDYLYNYVIVMYIVGSAWVIEHNRSDWSWTLSLYHISYVFAWSYEHLRIVDTY